MGKLQRFASSKLNDIGQQVIELDNQFQLLMDKAQKNITSAFQTRWEQGKLISENLEDIKEELRKEGFNGTQKEFADHIGKSEAMISNNKRAYEYLLDQGCETWDEVVKLLKNKDIPISSRSFEKIGTLLNEPTKDTKQVEQVDKDRKRLEELRAEADELLRRIEPAKKPELYEDALEAIEDLNEIQEYIESFNIYKSNWKSEKYLDFVRNFGYDIVTEEPCERCDPHHTLPDGGSGGMGDKVADFFTIPVSRGTHMLLEGGVIHLTREQTLEALMKTMATFISRIK